MPRKKKASVSIYDSTFKSISSGRMLTPQDEAEIEQKRNRIERISLTNNITLQAWQKIARLQVDKLVHLDLTSNMLTTQACRVISQGKWPLLHLLWLRRNDICDAGMSHLAKTYWPGLQYIGLSQTKVTAQCLYHFKDCNWPQLNKEGCNMKGTDGIAQLMFCPSRLKKSDRPKFLTMKILDAYCGSVMDIL